RNDEREFVATWNDEREIVAPRNDEREFVATWNDEREIVAPRNDGENLWRPRMTTKKRIVIRHSG
ncbi:MAG: hypothetical protein KJS83_11510, partial [Xanthomonadaceae bacterium]|nr:hypothetical protein [Xanthomonadaceae bacterium]